MCDKKFVSSVEVPQKFCEWLLAMGCSHETVPSLDKVSRMCRGQYYVVWRDLMEKVHPKDEIRVKRLTVFCDDVKKCKSQNNFTENARTVVPEELSLWRRQIKLKEKVGEAEGRAKTAKESLDLLMDKISVKLSQCNIASRKVQDLHRRVSLLQLLAEELNTKKGNLHETRNIAESLCCTDESCDIDSKVTSCTSLLRRQSSVNNTEPAVKGNPADCTTVVSNQSDNDAEEQLTSLVRCRGDKLWPVLYEKRNSLLAAMSNNNHIHTISNGVKRETPQTILSHTAALHCFLALEAAKNKIHIKQRRKRLVEAVAELSKYLTGDSCELLVMKCVEGQARARIASLRANLQYLMARDDIFKCTAGRVSSQPTEKLILDIDKAIEAKKGELKKSITCLAATERKTQNVMECLLNTFNGFHKDSLTNDSVRFRGNQTEKSQESISLLMSFYEQRREKRSKKVELSLDMDASDRSLSDIIDADNIKFVDELKTYIKKFKLENNRKLVLESGEKVWLFETIQSSIDTIYSTWLDNDVACSLLCPSVSLVSNINRLMEMCSSKEMSLVSAKILNGGDKIRPIDVISREEEERTVDRIKKNLKENLINLKKTTKLLDLGKENLKFWSSNQIRKYISSNRSINGMNYKQCEQILLDNLGPNIRY